MGTSTWGRRAERRTGTEWRRTEQSSGGVSRPRRLVVSLPLLSPNTCLTLNRIEKALGWGLEPSDWARWTGGLAAPVSARRQSVPTTAGWFCGLPTGRFELGRRHRTKPSSRFVS
jgi:hypothetical protein